MNKALCRLRIGEIEPAAHDMISAYGHAPNEPNAVAHKILAHWLLGNPQEACDFGDVALIEMPNNELAAFYLIQARADISTVIDPLDGLSDILRDRPQIRVAEIMFLRRRQNADSWWRKAKESAARYPEDEELGAAAAFAVVDEITHDQTANATRTLSEAQRTALSAAAPFLDRAWSRVRQRLNEPLEQGVQYLSAALVCAHYLRDQPTVDALLTVIDEEELTDPGVITTAARVLEDGERQDLLDRLLNRAIEHPAVRFQAAMAALQRGEVSEGLQFLNGAVIPPEEAAPLRVLQALAPWLSEETRPSSADLEAVVPLADDDPRALIFIARTARDHDLVSTADQIFAQAVALAANGGTLSERATVAISASAMGQHTDVIELLNDAPGAFEDDRLLLRLARAHANETPRRIRNLKFFEQLPDDQIVDREIAGHRAAFYASVNKPEALDLAQALHHQEPNDAFAAALLVNQLRIAGRYDDLKTLAEKIDPAKLEGQVKHKMIVVHAIRTELDPRLALRIAYQIMLAEPNDVDAVTGYTSIQMAQMVERKGDNLFEEQESIKEDCWVKLTTPHDATLTFVIGSDERVPGTEVFSVRHPIAAAALGKRVGDTFEFQKQFGVIISYTVQEIKSKYLSTWQHLVGSFSERFPNSTNIVSVPVGKGDFSSLEMVMRHRNEAIDRAISDYRAGQLPLAFCARSIGSDPVTFAHAVRSKGGRIVVSVGETEELVAALAVGRSARGAGIILDPFTSVIAANIGALKALKEYFGEILTSHSTVRLLDSIREQLSNPSPDGLMQVGFGEEGLYREITTPETIEAHRVHTESMISIVRDSFTIELALIPDNAPQSLVDLVSVAGERVFDSISLARNKNLPILSDDLVYRNFSYVAAEVPGLWLQAAFLLCREANTIDGPTYVKYIANLARLKHGHTILDIETMREAFELGLNDNYSDFKALSSYIGVPGMVLPAHARFIVATWLHIRNTVPIGKEYSVNAALGIMLENFMRGAGFGWQSRIMSLVRIQRSNEYLSSYLISWLRGHFYIDDNGDVIPHRRTSTRADKRRLTRKQSDRSSKKRGRRF